MSEKKTSSPPADRLKPKGNWKESIRSALAKKRPPDGWPKPKQKKGSVP
jgi:hypothetical protein